ncbi:hypothetical protein ABPG73_005515 [Tetrahymena malaccensis]
MSILTENQIGHEGASGLASALASCTNLSNLTLDLSYNKIGANGASGLGSGLASCINFSNLTLDLCGNQIGNEGASGLGSGLASCINLSNLTRKDTLNFLKEQKVQPIVHPPQNPDLNPIKRVWERNIYENVDQLICTVNEVWNNMDFQIVKNKISHHLSIIKQVKQNYGKYV